MPMTSSTHHLPFRQQQICQLIHDAGYLSVEQLAKTFDVTPQTIRRDINVLCDLGLLKRHHGGVSLVSTVENAAYTDRQVQNLEAKQQIAAGVAALIPHYASLFINIGTTTEEVARQLLSHRGLRVITNNINVATTLAQNTDFDVLITGGSVRARDLGVTGEATIDMVSQFKVDFGIIGISGIDADGSLLDFDYHEVRVAQAIIRHSRQVIMVADHSKFGRSASVRLGHLNDINHLVIDRYPEDSAFQDTLAHVDTELHAINPA